jgi:hypothetical protein
VQPPSQPANQLNQANQPYKSIHTDMASSKSMQKQDENSRAYPAESKTDVRRESDPKQAQIYAQPKHYAPQQRSGSSKENKPSASRLSTLNNT